MLMLFKGHVDVAIKPDPILMLFKGWGIFLNPFDDILLILFKPNLHFIFIAC